MEINTLQHEGTISKIEVSNILKRVLLLNASPQKLFPTGEDIWPKLLSRQLQDYLDENRIKIIKYVSEKYQKAVGFGRQGKINFAYQFIFEAEQMSTALVSDDALIVSVFGLPARAYLFYREAKYENALEKTIEAMEVDQGLELRGYSLFHFHRIQQLHNICRVYFKTKPLSEAAALANELLKYLMLGKKITSFTGLWDVHFLENAPQQLRSALIVQVFNEVHSYFIRVSNAQNSKSFMFRSLFEGLNGNFDAITESDDILKKWLELKELECAQQYNQYFIRAMEFLEQGDVRFDYYKYHVVIDMIGILLRQVDLADDDALLTALRGYANTKLYRKEFFISSIVSA